MDSGWSAFAEVVHTLASEEFPLDKIEKIGLHFRSRTFSRASSNLPGRENTPECDQSRRECLSRVLSVTEPLFVNQCQSELDITIDQIPISSLLHLLKVDEETEILQTPTDREVNSGEPGSFSFKSRGRKRTDSMVHMSDGKTDMHGIRITEGSSFVRSIIAN